MWIWAHHHLFHFLQCCAAPARFQNWSPELICDTEDVAIMGQHYGIEAVTLCPGHLSPASTFDMLQRQPGQGWCHWL